MQVPSKQNKILGDAAGFEPTLQSSARQLLVSNGLITVTVMAGGRHFEASRREDMFLAGRGLFFLSNYFPFIHE